MILINMLPPHLRPVKRSELPYILSGLVVLLAVVVMAMLYLQTAATIVEKETALRDHRVQLAELSSIVAQSNELETLKKKFADQVATINELVSDRIIWSRQLWNLNRLALDNLWFKGIVVKTVQFRETVQQMNAQTKKMEAKEITVPRLVLQVNGYVILKEGNSDITPFLYKTTNPEDEFAKLFRLEPPSVKDTEYEGFPAKEFELQFLVGGGEAE